MTKRLLSVLALGLLVAACASDPAGIPDPGLRDEPPLMVGEVESRSSRPTTPDESHRYILVKKRGEECGLFLNVPADAEIMRKVDGRYVALGYNDLAVGMTVAVWNGGHSVLDSCPQSTAAAAIEVLLD